MLVIVAAGMVALVAAVGLVVDVGIAWAENRGSQNGTDAVAEAGAVVILENATRDPSEPEKTDSDVWQAVADMADKSGISVEDAEYVRWQDGAWQPMGIAVGDGGPIPSEAQGVQAVGSRVHQTLLARVVGVTEINIETTATAVSGPVTDPCPDGGGCALLPVTFPTTVTNCDGQNKSVPTEDPWEQNGSYVFPLCGNDAGAYGWIDWTAPGGGAGEIWEQVCNPDPPSIVLPGWFEVVQAGNPNPQKLEDCFNETWAGKVILVPLFDDKCKDKPAEGEPCTDSGSPKWYHFPAYAAIQLDWAYINGNPGACDMGNGATRCLHGTFVDAVVGGAVGPIGEGGGGSTPSSFYAVQLVE